MKKLMMLFVAALTFGIAVGVSAISEDQLYSELTKTRNVNGATYTLRDDQKKAIKDYLDAYEISSADADQIVAKVNQAESILKNSGKTRFYDMTKAQKDQVRALVAEISALDSIDCAIVGKDLVVYAPNSSQVFYKTPIEPNANGAISYTDSTVVVAGLGLISALGIALAFKKAKNA